MLELEFCCDVDTIFPIVFGLIYRLAGYKKSLKITNAHAMHSPLFSRVRLGDWRLGWTSENMKGFVEEACELRKWKWGRGIFFVCLSGVYTVKFHLLDSFGRRHKGFGNVSVLDGFVYGHCKVHFKKRYKTWYGSRLIRMQKTVRFKEQNQRGELHTMSLKVGSS